MNDCSALVEPGVVFIVVMMSIFLTGLITSLVVNLFYKNEAIKKLEKELKDSVPF